MKSWVSRIVYKNHKGYKVLVQGLTEKLHLIHYLQTRKTEHFLSSNNCDGQYWSLYINYLYAPLVGHTGLLSSIDPLNGMNYSSWIEQIKIALGVMELDFALRVDRPPSLTDKSTVEEKRVIDQWERSNRMSLMIIKNSISLAIRGAIPDSETTKGYLNSVEEQFKGTSKAHASTLILKMLTTKYDGVSGVREHILIMNDMANKLKSMVMEISEGFLVHFIMTSLPAQFGPFKINYNTQKEKWKMSELIAMCVQEEGRLKIEKPDVAHLTTTNSYKRKFNDGAKGSHKGNKSNNGPNKSQKTGPSTSGTKREDKCRFCKKLGHTQHDCPKFKEWLAKKGIPYKENIEKQPTDR